MVCRYANEQSSRLSPSRLLALAAILLATLLIAGAGTATARRVEKYDPGAHIAVRAHAAKPAAHTTEAKPAGESPEPPPGGAGATEESPSYPLTSEGDPLAENGLESPFCRNPRALSMSVQNNCETSDFVAAADPTGNYTFDVNINTSVVNWSNDVSATIENFLQFGWITLVTLVHGILVMFEWCYSPGLISGSAMKQVAQALHDAQLTFTKPWMDCVLAVASMLALYHGLIRRRVAETLGQVLMMLAMMIGGLWVIANPTGTVGVVGEWANSASLGTLSAVTATTPESGERTLANQMENVFTTVISGPWCYLEFGNEKWCESPGQRDENLEKAARKIAGEEEEKSRCSTSCPASASREDRALAISARLLKSARSNGELFLALPANQVQRNSAKTEGTLLNVLCGKAASADDCTGDTAPQAEFRSERDTGARAIGLVLIWIGALGMLLLFGFLAFRLFEAALASLFYLLLAPAAVLAPALGDGGRAAFRAWGVRLLGAFVGKLIYSFLLGVVLLMMRMLMQITVLGWWAQWLLMSALWWIVLHHRHKALGFVHGSQQGHESGSMRWYYRVRMVQDAAHAAGWARRKLASPPASTNRPLEVPQAQGHGPGSGGSGEPLRPTVDPGATAKRPEHVDPASPRRADGPSEDEPQSVAERPVPEPATTTEEERTGPTPDPDLESRQTEANPEEGYFDEHITPPPGRHSTETSDMPLAEDLETPESPLQKPRAEPPEPVSAQPAGERQDTASPPHPESPRREANEQSKQGSSAPQQPSGRGAAPPPPSQHGADAHRPSTRSPEEPPATDPDTPPPANASRERAPSSRGSSKAPGAPAAKAPGRTRDTDERQRQPRRALDETPYEKLSRQLRLQEKKPPSRRQANRPPGGRNR
jgi:hypothetical protein